MLSKRDNPFIMDTLHANLAQCVYGQFGFFMIFTWVYLKGAKNFWTELNFFVQFVQFDDLLQVNFWYAIKRLHVSTWRKLPSTYLKKWIPHCIMIVFVVLYTCGHGRIWKKSSCYCMVYDLLSGLAEGNFCQGVLISMLII